MSAPGLLPTWAAVEGFLFAGDATVTLVSKRTGVRFTYKVRVKKTDLSMIADGRADGDTPFFVNLLRGPDNEADFAYMGVARRDPARFFWTEAARVGRQAPAHKAFVWMLDAMRRGRDVLGSSLEVWHEGRCGRCGRKLTVPDSIAAGLGPECERMAA